jgi:CheY-like chemotaxis protein
VVVSIVARENRGLLLGEVEVVDKSSLEHELPAALQRTLGSSRKTALVVEDDETIREMISKLLAREGLDVQEAANGREALLLLERLTPDVIFLDLTMPVMDGVSFLEAIRKEPRHARRPVIVITACDPSHPEVERIRTQAQAVVEKGMGLEESLRRLLAEILARNPTAR